MFRRFKKKKKNDKSTHQPNGRPVSSDKNGKWLIMSTRMPVKASGIAAITVASQGKIAVVGARGLCHTFDTNTKRWDGLPRMEKDRFNCAAVLQQQQQEGDAIYMIGGFSQGMGELDSAQVLRLNPKQKRRDWEWQELPNMSFKREGCAAVIVQDDTIVVVGGQEKRYASLLKTAEAFDVKRNTWRPLPDMLTCRYGCAAATVKDCVFVFGGYNHEEKELQTAEFYNFRTNVWSPLPEMPQSRFSPAAVVVGHMIYVVGGVDGIDQKLREVDVFDTVAMKWNTHHRPIPSLNTGRCQCGVAFWQGILYVLGGTDQDNEYLDTVEMIRVVDEENLPTVVPDYSEFATRTELTIEIAKLEKAYNDCSGKFDMDSILVAEEANEKLPSLKAILSTMPTVEELNDKISVLEKEMMELQAQRDFKRLRLLSTERQQLIDQLQKEEEMVAAQGENEAVNSSTKEDETQAQGEMQHTGKDLLVFDKYTWATELITRSGQADVYRGIRRLKKQQEQEVAIKAFHSHNAWEECKTELRNLLRLPPHPNVMEILDFDRLPKPAYIMKFVHGGDLRQHLNTHGGFSPADAREILLGIGSGLDHLHKNGVVHRDLKSPNILLEQQDNNKLCPVLIDLGLGKTTENNTSMAVTTGGKGTACWMAPEMILNREWNTKTDVYALGIIMWEIFTGKMPYPDFQDMQAIGNVINGGRPDLDTLTAMGTTKEQRDLVEALWNTDPKKRPSVESFLTQVKELFECPSPLNGEASDKRASHNSTRF